MLCKYAELSLTRGGSPRVRRAAYGGPTVVPSAKFGEIWRNFERGARVRVLSAAQSAPNTMYHIYIMCGARLGV